MQEDFNAILAHADPQETTSQKLREQSSDTSRNDFMQQITHKFKHYETTTYM